MSDRSHTTETTAQTAQTAPGVSGASATSRPAPATDPSATLLDQMGGVPGLVYNAIPVVAFVAANAAFGLPVAIGIAVAVALAIMGVRLLRKERFSQTVGGLFGVLIAGGVAAWTGSAGGFFLIGIWANLAGAVVTLASVLARRPLTGGLWNLLHGGKHDWRADRPALRGHDLATLTLTTMFAARFVVQYWLYGTEATGWLAFTKIAMGTPLLALALIVVVWAFRRSTKRLVTS